MKRTKLTGTHPHNVDVLEHYKYSIGGDIVASAVFIANAAYPLSGNLNHWELRIYPDSLFTFVNFADVEAAITQRFKESVTEADEKPYPSR